MDVKPDFERIRKAARFEEADRVPLAEIQFQGLEEIFEMPHIAGVWVVDDLAFGNGTMSCCAAGLSPRLNPA